MKDQRLHIQIAGANRIITIVDDHSGINSSTIKYARAAYGKTTDTTPEPSPWNTPTTYTINTNNKVTFSILKGSEWYTWVKVKDKAGNESIVSLEFGEDPQIKVSNTYGGRWSPNLIYKDNPGTEIDADMMTITYGYYGAIQYEISGLSAQAKIYYLLADSKIEDRKDIIAEIGKETTTEVDRGEDPKETEYVPLKVTNWGNDDKAKYLYIVVKKSNGDYVVGGNKIMSKNIIQIEAVNGTYLNEDKITIANNWAGNSAINAFIISGISDICEYPGNYNITITYDNLFGTQTIAAKTTTYNDPTSKLITIKTNDSVYTGLGTSKVINISITNKTTPDKWTSSVEIFG